MKKLLLVLAICLTPGAAYAQRAWSTYSYTKPEAELTAVDLSGLIGTRTFTVTGVGGWSNVGVWVDFTHANNGTLTLACTAGPEYKDAGGRVSTDTGYTLQGCTWALGICTQSDTSTFVTASLTGDKKYYISVPVLGADTVTCSITHGGVPTSSDLVTIRSNKSATSQTVYF